MKNRPLVTLGLPVHNGAKYLERALESVLSQTFVDFELIISDNASTDETELICRRFMARDSRISYRQNESNIGLAANHNVLVHLSQGKYFKWIAHDDECHPSMLARCVAALDAAPPNVVAIYTHYDRINEFGDSIGIISDSVASASKHAWQRLAHYLMNASIYNFTYALIRKEILQKTPLYGLYPTSDRILFAELSMLGELQEIREPLVKYRIHPASSFRAQQTLQARRELFDPSVVGKRSLLSHEGRLHLELVRRASQVDQALTSKILCIVVALLIPPWQRFRNFGGRCKHRIRYGIKNPVPLR